MGVLFMNLDIVLKIIVSIFCIINIIINIYNIIKYCSYKEKFIKLIFLINWVFIWYIFIFKF
jgi:hypothetical protein